MVLAACRNNCPMLVEGVGCDSTTVCMPMDQGASQWRFFHHNEVSMEVPFCSHPNLDALIATKFCTCHDSTAVVTCAKICSNLMGSDRITAQEISHCIWILSAKSSVKWAPYYCWWHNWHACMMPTHDAMVVVVTADKILNTVYNCIVLGCLQLSVTVHLLKAVHQGKISGPYLALIFLLQHWCQNISSCWWDN